MALALAVGWGDTETVALGLGLGAGVSTTTCGVGQPNGTGLTEMVGVGESAGDTCAWITIGVVLGQGGVTGMAVGDAALTISTTNTARPPSRAVTTNRTAPHSRLR